MSAVPGVAAAGPLREARLEHRVSQLKDQRAKLKKRLVDAREQRNSAWARITVLEGEGSGYAATIKQHEETISTLTVERYSLRAERDSLVTERDQALSGLPEAIKAVPLDQFWSLVLTPARAAWPCDDYYAGTDGYWSVSFYDPSPYC